MKSSSRWASRAACSAICATSRTPGLVALVGALFALSFDTLSQAALFALTATQFGGWEHALLLATLFMLGMLLTDGINGLWIARLIARADQVALIASRVMGLVVSGVSLLVAAFGAAKMLSPAVDAWSEGKELIFGFTLVAIIAVSFVVAVRLTRRPVPGLVTSGGGWPGNSAFLCDECKKKTDLVSYLLLAVSGVGAHESTELSAVEVRAKAENLEGIAAAGSEGVVSSQRLAAVPILRPGEALEMVPGLIVTQHAGDGKANQYFLRGFNLDHGTDFATYVGGVPVNMPTHAHGQGYSDLNFLIPELVDRISFRKGPYFAEEGDFSSAGAAHIDYFRKLDASLAQLTLGQNGYARTCSPGRRWSVPAICSTAWNCSTTTDRGRSRKTIASSTVCCATARAPATTGLADRHGLPGPKWTSTDQVAERAIASGQVGRFGTLDPTTGGETSRYSLSGEWAKRWDNAQSRANVCGCDSSLDLWSNFQYCLDDFATPARAIPATSSNRPSAGRPAASTASHAVFDRWGGFEVENSIGLQGRIDHLNPVGLYATSARQTQATVREDKVTQRSLSLWAQNETRWAEWFRSVQGLRADAYDFNVNASLAANSGKASDQMVTPKLALIFGRVEKDRAVPELRPRLPFQRRARHHHQGRSERRGNAGADRQAAGSRTKGYELGVRSEVVPGWQSTLSLWNLDAASELLFVGDAGTTEPSRPSRRYGVEWTQPLCAV